MLYKSFRCVESYNAFKNIKLNYCNTVYVIRNYLPHKKTKKEVRSVRDYMRSLHQQTILGKLFKCLEQPTSYSVTVDLRQRVVSSFDVEFSSLENNALQRHRLYYQGFY